MSSFSYYSDIPQANNIISQSQGQILTNFESIGSWTNVDHYSFGTGIDGEHKQITFAKENVPGGAPANPASVAYTQAGQASTVADMYFQNQNAPFLLNCLRAFGTFSGGMAPTLANGFNVQSIAFAAGIYTVTFNANVTNAAEDPVVYITQRNPASSGTLSLLNYTYAANAIEFTGTANPALIYSFIVFQA